jgi:lipoyl(octanoyl) transferase
MPSDRRLIVRRLGVVGYGEGLELQKALVAQRAADEIDDTLLLLQHPHVLTLGVKAGESMTHVLATPERLAELGVEVHETGRGGDVTYHGPGQLVGYPILDLQQLKPDLHWYLRQLEEALIRTLGGFDIPAERNAGYTGVWTRGRKIASIGIHVRQWVTWHGFALNVTTDLSAFDLIVPCGIPDVVMTSVVRESPSAAGMRTESLGALVADSMITSMCAVFGYQAAVAADDRS